MGNERMPGIDTITAAILEDARQQAEAVLEDARAKARGIAQQATERAEKSARELTGQAAQEAAEYGRRMESMADLSCRRARLEVKQQLLDKLFDQALQALSAMEDRDYLALITDLMVEAAEGNEQVVVAPGEGRIDSAFLAGINNRLKAEGRCGELKLAERREPMAGGFILDSRGVEINCSFEMLVRQARPVMEKEAAALLFEA
jgi:V/A-type H+-transporting ATPase subunit E